MVRKSYTLEQFFSLREEALEVETQLNAFPSLEKIEELARDQVGDDPEAFEELMLKAQAQRELVQGKLSDLQVQIEAMRSTVVKKVVETLKPHMHIDTGVLTKVTSGEMALAQVLQDQKASLSFQYDDPKSIAANEAFSRLFELADIEPALCQQILSGIALGKIAEIRAKKSSKKKSE